MSDERSPLLADDGHHSTPTVPSTSADLFSEVAINSRLGVFHL